MNLAWKMYKNEILMCGNGEYIQRICSLGAKKYSEYMLLKNNFT